MLPDNNNDQDSLSLQPYYSEDRNNFYNRYRTLSEANVNVGGVIPRLLEAGDIEVEQLPTITARFRVVMLS